MRDYLTFILAHTDGLWHSVYSAIVNNWEHLWTVIVLPILGRYIFAKLKLKRDIKRGKVSAPEPKKTKVLDFITKKKYTFTEDELDKCRLLYDKDDEQDKDDPISATALDLQNQVQGYCEHLLNAIEGADRVLIHKFHNGGKYHTGVSTQKMKLVYEATQKRGRRVDNELSQQGFVLERMGGILKKLAETKYIFINLRDRNDRETFCFTPYFQILDDDGVSANHMSILRSNGKYRNIGVLSIHFFKKKNGLTSKEMMIISKARRDIALMLIGDINGYPKNLI